MCVCMCCLATTTCNQALQFFHSDKTTAKYLDYQLEQLIGTKIVPVSKKNSINNLCEKFISVFWQGDEVFSCCKV